MLSCGALSASLSGIVSFWQSSLAESCCASPLRTNRRFSLLCQVLSCSFWLYGIARSACATMPGAGAADRRLLMLVEKGDINGVTKLLGGGADVNGSRWLDFRPLISAARYARCVSGIVSISQRNCLDKS